MESRALCPPPAAHRRGLPAPLVAALVLAAAVPWYLAIGWLASSLRNDFEAIDFVLSSGLRAWPRPVARGPAPAPLDGCAPAPPALVWLDEAGVARALRSNELPREAGPLRIQHPDGHFALKLYVVPPGSLFAMAGLCGGDEIRAVNGVSLSDPDAALEAWTRVRRDRRADLEIGRRGRSYRIDVRLIEPGAAPQ